MEISASSNNTVRCRYCGIITNDINEHSVTDRRHLLLVYIINILKTLRKGDLEDILEYIVGGGY